MNNFKVRKILSLKKEKIFNLEFFLRKGFRLDINDNVCFRSNSDIILEDGIEDEVFENLRLFNLELMIIDLTGE